jgi:hypothetical protein
MKTSVKKKIGSDGVGLQIDNLVNVVRDSNIEVAMRLVSGLNNGRAFYSDLNGLQVLIVYK